MKSIAQEQVQVPDTTIVENITSTAEYSTDNSFWFWIAMIQIIIILFLLIKLSKNKPQKDDEIKQLLKKSRNKDIDMNDLMMSITNSKSLYKEMSSVCHPDRFVEEEKKQVAEEIFQEITRYKRDYKKLKELMSEAEEKLNITFKN